MAREKTQKEIKKQERKFPRRMLIVTGILAVILIIVVWALFTFGYISFSEEIHRPVNVNYENLPNYLEQSSFVEDLPKDASVSLTIGSKEYSLAESEVSEGDAENPDIKISIPEKYLEEIGSKGICEAVSSALENNELSFEKELSDAELLWKYKGMLKYKKCVGL